MLRNTFLFLSRRRSLRRWMETSRLGQRLTSRFVAGRTLDDVMRVCRKLAGENILSTLDHLGENVTSEPEAVESRRAMEETLDRIAASGLPASISIKLTQFGLDISGDCCLANVRPLARRANEAGLRVEVDMESSAYTERTLAIVERLHGELGCLRAVVQAYLHRTAADVERLNRAAIPVRLCKGAYDEPAAVAFSSKEEVDANFLKLSRVLLEHGTQPAFATHDPRMIEGVLSHPLGAVARGGQFEFQMLYGVRRDLQRKLVRTGYRLRLYVPYGDAWYPYFMRRLAERPANVLFLARNLLRA
jgi:proline dehydrogenase